MGERRSYRVYRSGMERKFPLRNSLHHLMFTLCGGKRVQKEYSYSDKRERTIGACVNIADIYVFE